MASISKCLKPILYYIYVYIFLLAFPAIAQESNYYSISEQERPPSAFSLCCCKKERQTTEEVFYSCRLYDEKELEGKNSCPSDSQQYVELGINCPNTLMLKKYKQ